MVAQLASILALLLLVSLADTNTTWTHWSNTRNDLYGETVHLVLDTATSINEFRSDDVITVRYNVSDDKTTLRQCGTRGNGCNINFFNDTYNVTITCCVLYLPSCLLDDCKRIVIDVENKMEDDVFMFIELELLRRRNNLSNSTIISNTRLSFHPGPDPNETTPLSDEIERLKDLLNITKENATQEKINHSDEVKDLGDLLNNATQKQINLSDELNITKVNANQEQTNLSAEIEELIGTLNNTKGNATQEQTRLTGERNIVIAVCAILVGTILIVGIIILILLLRSYLKLKDDYDRQFINGSRLNSSSVDSNVLIHNHDIA